MVGQIAQYKLYNFQLIKHNLLLSPLHRKNSFVVNDGRHPSHRRWLVKPLDVPLLSFQCKQFPILVFTIQRCFWDNSFKLREREREKSKFVYREKMRVSSEHCHPFTRSKIIVCGFDSVKRPEQLLKVLDVISIKSHSQTTFLFWLYRGMIEKKEGNKDSLSGGLPCADTVNYCGINTKELFVEMQNRLIEKK